MQTFSYLRRSRFNLQPLIALLLFCAALFYESMGTIYLYLSPLLGIGFYFWRKYHTDKKSYFYIGLFFLYTLYFEIDREMILFSFILLATFYHLFLAPKIETAINCTVCIYLIYVLYAYLGYYLFNLFLAFLFNINLPSFDPVYFIYMATDLFILVLIS
jgi:hypothetical protein